MKLGVMLSKTASQMEQRKENKIERRKKLMSRGMKRFLFGD
jgi:hypothetical protein